MTIASQIVVFSLVISGAISNANILRFYFVIHLFVLSNFLIQACEVQVLASGRFYLKTFIKVLKIQRSQQKILYEFEKLYSTF